MGTSKGRLRTLVKKHNITILVVPEPFLSDRHMQFFAKKIKLIGCGSNKGNEKIFGFLEGGFSHGMDWGISSSYT